MSARQFYGSLIALVIMCVVFACTIVAHIPNVH